MGAAIQSVHREDANSSIRIVKIRHEEVSVIHRTGDSNCFINNEIKIVGDTFIKRGPTQQPSNPQIEVDTQVPVKNKSVREQLKVFYAKKVTQSAVSGIIILNGLLDVVQTTKWTDTCCVYNKKAIKIIDQIDTCFLVFYTLELGLNFYAHFFWEFWLKSKWNWFDLFVIIGSWIASQDIASIRLFRTLRLIRITGRYESLAFVIETLFKSMSGIGGLLLLLMVVLVIYGVLGVGLYREDSEMFEDFFTASWTLFITLNGESWPDFAEPLFDRYWHAALYFATYVIIQSVVFLNMIIALFIEKSVKFARMQMVRPIRTAHKMKHMDGLPGNLNVNTLQFSSESKSYISPSGLCQGCNFSRADAQRCAHTLFKWESLNLISRSECRRGINLILTIKGFHDLSKPILNGRHHYVKKALCA